MNENIGETIKHIQQVRCFINFICHILKLRGECHDLSKLENPEVELFDEFTPKLKNSTYGSEEYNQFLKDLKPALDHHYANNMHHPEAFPSGINDMNLIDLLEMVCDWKAATMRHSDGNFEKSVLYNVKRFNIDPQLAQIIMNTGEAFDFFLNNAIDFDKKDVYNTGEM
jgi:hypothetical protein